MANSEDEKQQALLKKLSEQGAETKEEASSSPESATSKDTPVSEPEAEVTDKSAERSNPRQREYNAPSFEEMVNADVMYPIPSEELVQTLRNSLNKVHNQRSFVSGPNERRMPKQDIYSGIVDEISMEPIIFPERTGYGEDAYVVVHLDNDLRVYVPARQAGLMQPRTLTQMRGQRKSVVITALFDRDNDNEFGNLPTSYAIGSIQSAEYQIGAELRAESVNHQDAFLNYTRTGFVERLIPRDDSVVVTVDLTREGKGYLSIKTSVDKLVMRYRWQHVNDIPFLQEGQKINFRFTEIIEREIDNEQKHIKGTYFELGISREDIPGFAAEEKGKLFNAIRGNVVKGYVYGISNRTGVLVELAPGRVFAANPSFRGVSRNLQLTKNDVRKHTTVYCQLDPRIHDLESLRRVKRPVIITGIAREFEDNQMALNKGTYSMPSQKAINKSAQRLSISPKNKRRSPRDLQFIDELGNRLNGAGSDED